MMGFEKLSRFGRLCVFFCSAAASLQAIVNGQPLSSCLYNEIGNGQPLLHGMPASPSPHLSCHMCLLPTPFFLYQLPTASAAPTPVMLTRAS